MRIKNSQSGGQIFLNYLKKYFKKSVRVMQTIKGLIYLNFS